jgi:hypothetical protein
MIGNTFGMRDATLQPVHAWHALQHDDSFAELRQPTECLILHHKQPDRDSESNSNQFAHE